MHDDQLKITRLEQISPVHTQFGEHDEFERFPVIPRDAGHQCGVYFYRLPPGKANFPYHYHEVNEEVFYIISGNGIVLTEDGEKTISAGDVIFCPPAPGGAHKIANTSANEPLVYIEFDSVRYPDVVHYPKTGAFGILRHDSVDNEFFREGPQLDYAAEVETPDRDW